MNKEIKNKNLSGKDGLNLGFGGLATGFGGMMFESKEEKKSRKVGRYGEDENDLVIDTCYTTDTKFFETGIVDKRYRKDKKWIIVEEYKTKKEAEVGQEKWVKLLTGNDLPSSITDVHTDQEYKLNE